MTPKEICDILVAKALELGAAQVVLTVAKGPGDGYHATYGVPVMGEVIIERPTPKPIKVNHKWNGQGARAGDHCDVCGLERRGTIGAWRYKVDGEWTKTVPSCRMTLLVNMKRTCTECEWVAGKGDTTEVCRNCGHRFLVKGLSA